MASTYSDELRLELQANGENSTTWGTKTNSNLGFIEDAISGMATVAVNGTGDTALTNLSAATDEARMAILKLTGTITGNITVSAPANSKHYIVWNATSGAFTVTIQITGGGGTGVVVPTGKTAFLFTDGTDFYHADTTTDSLLVVTGIVPDADDGAYLGTSSLGFSDLFLASGAVINWDGNDVILTHSANALALTGGTFSIDTGLLPDANDGAYLGQAGTAFSDLFLASGGVVNWDSGDVVLTHSANDLALTGGTLTIDTGLMPNANDGAYLGQSGTAFSDLFLASGAVINWNAGDVTLTHSGNQLTMTGGSLFITGSFYASFPELIMSDSTGIHAPDNTGEVWIGGGSSNGAVNGAIIRAHGSTHATEAGNVLIAAALGTGTIKFNHAGTDTCLELDGTSANFYDKNITTTGTLDCAALTASGNTNITNGSLLVGTNDTTQGTLYMYGGATTTGGTIRLYNAADGDTTDQYYVIRPVSAAGESDLQIRLNTTGLLLEYDYSLSEWDFQSYNIRTTGNISVGADDTTKGLISLYGGTGAAQGGTLDLYNDAGQDTTIDYWRVMARNGSFAISKTAGSPDLEIDTTGRLLTGAASALGGEAGSLTVSTGDSGVTSAHVSYDDFVVETDGIGGASILTPDANSGQLAFGTPSDNVGAYLRWNYGAAGGTQLATLGTNTASGQLTFETASSTEAMRIDANQDVGIGETTPDARLHVKDTAGIPVAIFENSTVGGTAIQVHNVTTGSAGAIFDTYHNSSNPQDNDAIGRIRFLSNTSNDAGGTTTLEQTNAQILVTMPDVTDLSEDSRMRLQTRVAGDLGVRVQIEDDVTISTGNLVIGTSGKGIDFDPAGSGAAANLLDDYEEGLHTATITCSSSGTITLLSANDTLAYTKIGRQVTVSGMLRVSSVSSPTGYMIISLPIAIAANTEDSDFPLGICVVNGAAAANSADFVGYGGAGSSEFRVFLGDANALQSDSAQEIGANDYIHVSLTYNAAT